MVWLNVFWKMILKGWLIIKIILYSTNCPKCKILKAKLDEKNIEYIINSDVNEMLSKGFKIVPVLEVDERILNYLDAVKYIKGI